MKEIIGVTHTGSTHEKVYSYIQQKYGNKIKSVLLELHPNQEKDGYFSEIETKLKNDGIKVIRGDIHRYNDTWSKGYEDRIKEFNKTANTLAKEIKIKAQITSSQKKEAFKLFKIYIKLKTIDKIRLGINTLRHMGTRDDGFIKSIEKEDPDIVILGSLHTLAIIKKNKMKQWTILHTNEIQECLNPVILQLPFFTLLNKISQPDLIAYDDIKTEI